MTNILFSSQDKGTVNMSYPSTLFYPTLHTHSWINNLDRWPAHIFLLQLQTHGPQPKWKTYIWSRDLPIEWVCHSHPFLMRIYPHGNTHGGRTQRVTSLDNSRFHYNTFVANRFYNVEEDPHFIVHGAISQWPSFFSSFFKLIFKNKSLT